MSFMTGHGGSTLGTGDASTGGEQTGSKDDGEEDDGDVSNVTPCHV